MEIDRKGSNDFPFFDTNTGISSFDNTEKTAPVFCPNDESHDLVVNVLGVRRGAELTRRELEKIILDKLGFSLSNSVMADIFSQYDWDESGKVSVEALACFVDRLKQSARSGDQRVYLFAKVLDVTGGMGTAHALATFLDRKQNEELTRSELDKLILDKVGFAVSDDVMADIFHQCDADKSGKVSIGELAIFLDGVKGTNTVHQQFYVLSKTFTSMFFITSVMFLFALIVSGTLNIYARFGGTLGDDSFNWYGLNAILYIVGCYAYVAMVYDGIAANVELVELVRSKIVLWAESRESHDTDEEADMTPRQFFSVLEREGYFLPYDTFMTVFRQIDRDGGGSLSVSEIKSYAAREAVRPRLSRFRFHAKVYARCVVSPDYWINWGWVIGSVLFAVAAYKEGLPAIAYTHLNGMGCVLFLVCAVFQFVPFYKRTAAFLGRAEELNTIFVSLVKKESRSIAATSSGKRSDLSSSMIERKSDEEGNITEACNKIFKSFDVRGVDGAGDGNLDFIEFYDALNSFGFVIQLGVLRSIFNQADVNGDGTLQPEEFVKYVLSIKDNKRSQFDQFVQTVKAMATTTTWWLTWMQVLGGISITIASYANFSTSTLRNWSLLGNFCWMFPTLHFIYTIVTGHSNYYESLSRSKIKLKESISNAMYERQRGGAV